MVSALIATIIEYVGHLLLDRLFHVRLWDYSGRRFNLQGRVCLENSLGFGMLALLVIYVVHPLIARVLGLMPETVVIAVAFALLGILLVDLAGSVWTLIRLRPEIGAIMESFAELQNRVEAQILELQRPGDSLQRRLDRRRLNLLKAHRRNIGRLKRAFPDALVGRQTRPTRAAPDRRGG